MDDVASLSCVAVNCQFIWLLLLFIFNITDKLMALYAYFEHMLSLVEIYLVFDVFIKTVILLDVWLFISSLFFKQWTYSSRETHLPFALLCTLKLLSFVSMVVTHAPCLPPLSFARPDHLYNTMNTIISHLVFSSAARCVRIVVPSTIVPSKSYFSNFINYMCIFWLCLRYEYK